MVYVGWMVIKGHRSSKSTFGANNELLWFRNYLTKRTQYTNLKRNSSFNYSIEFSSLASFQNTCSFNCHLHYKDLSDKFCCSKYLFYLFQKYIYSNTYVQCLDLLAPSGALVVIMVYYKPLFQIFQILQIRK